MQRSVRRTSLHEGVLVAFLRYNVAKLYEQLLEVLPEKVAADSELEDAWSESITRLKAAIEPIDRLTERLVRLTHRPKPRSTERGQAT